MNLVGAAETEIPAVFSVQHVVGTFFTNLKFCLPHLAFKSTWASYEEC